jgi:5-methylcytosine-specific restriction endonuclease McrA
MVDKQVQKIQQKINYYCGSGKSLWSTLRPLDIMGKNYKGKIMRDIFDKAERNYWNRSPHYNPPNVRAELYHYTFFIKQAIHMRDSFICGICGKQNEIDDPVQIDHIIPKSKLPNSHPWNLQSSCENCNIEKSNRLLDALPIMLEGAKFRSEKIYDKQWHIEQIFTTLNFDYQIKSSLEIKFYEGIFNHIIKMNRNWDEISNYIVESK